LDDRVFNKFKQISSNKRDSKALVKVDIKLRKLDYFKCLNIIYLKGMR